MPTSGPFADRLAHLRAVRQSTIVAVHKLLTWSLDLIRILIGNMPKILQEMIASIISSQPRFQIVGKLGAGSDLLSAILQVGPEVVITKETTMLQDGGEDAGRLDAQYSVNVVAINETGREAALYSLNLQRTPLGKVSAISLISTIDRAAGHL